MTGREVRSIVLGLMIFVYFLTLMVLGVIQDWPPLVMVGGVGCIVGMCVVSFGRAKS